MTTTLEVLNEVQQLNQSFIYTYGWSGKDTEIYNKVVKAFENRQNTRNNIVMPCDVIEIYDKTGEHCFYKYATCEKASWYETGFGYCEQPSIHVTLNEDETLPQYFSVSGGSFGKLDPNKLIYVGETTRKVWTWGSHNACENGGIYANVRVNKYKLITDMEFIPYVLYTIKDSSYDYKYVIEQRHDNVYRGGGSFGGCFKTLQELKDYLRNYNFKIVGKGETPWNQYLKLNLSEEVNRQKVSRAEFSELSKNADRHFTYNINLQDYEACRVNNNIYYTLDK